MLTLRNKKPFRSGLKFGDSPRKKGRNQSTEKQMKGVILMIELLASSDIWLCSFLLCETEAKLVNLQKNINGINTIEFSLKGENLSILADSYYKQEALANVVELRNKLNFLRDIIFESRRQRKSGR